MNDEDFYNNIQNYLKEWEEFKDLALTHKKLKDLQTRWNSLREWLIKNQKADRPHADEYDGEMILDKMNELEGVDNENKDN